MVKPSNKVPKSVYGEKGRGRESDGKKENREEFSQKIVEEEGMAYIVVGGGSTLR